METHVKVTLVIFSICVTFIMYVIMACELEDHGKLVGPFISQVTSDGFMTLLVLTGLLYIIYSIIYGIYYYGEGKFWYLQFASYLVASLLNLIFMALIYNTPKSKEYRKQYNHTKLLEDVKTALEEVREKHDDLNLKLSIPNNCYRDQITNQLRQLRDLEKNLIILRDGLEIQSELETLPSLVKRLKKNNIELELDLHLDSVTDIQKSSDYMVAMSSLTGQKDLDDLVKQYQN